MNRWLNLWLLLVVSAAIGCGQAKQVAAPDTPDPGETTTLTPTVGASKINGETTESGSLVAMATQGSAEAAFQQTLIAFETGRLDGLFENLPPSYQSDVELLVQTFADKMDPQVWSSGFNLLNKIGTLLKTKKDLILSLEGVKRWPQIDLIKPHWDQIAGRINEIATSEFADVGKLKQSDVRHLAVMASRLIVNLPLPKFADVEVKTIASEGDTATLSYKESKGAAPQQVEFVRVEGKWLPKSIATNWSAGIEDAKERLTALPDQIAGWRPVAMQQFESIGGMIDQLQAAKTTDEFNTAVAPLIFTLAFGAQMAQEALRDADAGARKGNAITCVINRELKDSELTELRNVVLKSFGDPNLNSDYEMIPNDGKTRCRFTQVVDADALVTTIKDHFKGASVKFDADQKIIYVDTN